jgi:hypothetical protein
MIRTKKKTGIVRTKIRIVRTRIPPQKMSRVKDRNIKCWGVHYEGMLNRFYVSVTHYKSTPHYLKYNDAIKLKVNLEKMYYAKFEIRKQ